MSDDDLPLRGAMHRKPSRTEQYGLCEHMENYEMETSALHRKLQSKVEALRILRKELEKFRTERDQFKLMAETLQLRYTAIKRSSDLGVGGFVGSKTNLATLLHDTRERNLKLTTEVESLRQKLSELQGDIEILRAKEGKMSERNRKISTEVESGTSEEQQWKQERARFICHLENLKKKNAQLAFDFKTLIDEKEEIITERDAYKCKAHRLNHELFVALKANETHPKFLDIDSIILENKYLHERLKNLESEQELTKQSMNKYKTMLETKRKKGIIKLGNNSNTESILSHKQVKTILESGIDLPTKTETVQDLKLLCLALLDSLNDKNLALSHQKKTNKILATKIAELEQRIQCLIGLDEDAGSSCNEYSPSQMLLNGYCPSLVDSSNTNETTTTDTAVKTARNIDEDAGTISETDDTNKVSVGGGSDDGMSSLSTESGRSVLSSEYGSGGIVDRNDACSLSEFTRTALYAYKTPSSTTDSGNHIGGQQAHSKQLIPSSVARERVEDLKDLPPELAAIVQKALHELDLRDFDEVVDGYEGIGEEMLEQFNNVYRQRSLGEMDLEDEDDDTLQ